MKKVEKSIKIKNAKKMSNFKKIFISSLAVFSLTTTATIFGGLSVSNTNNTSSLVNNIKPTRNVSTTSDLNPPEVNDLYNDYSYESGYVTITGTTTINFYDWFGFNIWSYDASANLKNLFGATSATISTLKVKSSADGSQIYVYGYLSDSTSYFFILNTADGSVVQIGGKNALSGTNTLITNVNLLTVVDGCAILTQKTPIDNVSNTETITIDYSEINLSTGAVTNTNQDVTGSKQASSTSGSSTVGQVTTYGEIISVQKMGTTYTFDVKGIVNNNGNANSVSPVLLLIIVKNGAYGACYFSNFWAWTTPTNVSNMDLMDNTAFTVLNVTSSDGNTLTSYIAVKFDTTDTTTGSTDSSSPQYYTNPGLVISNVMTASSQQVSTLTLSSDTSDDAFAGITGFLYDKSSSTVYAVVASADSSSKFAIVSLTTSSNSIKWFDFSTIGVQTSDMQQVTIDFIPGASNVSNTTYGNTVIAGYAGYVEIKTEKTAGLNELTESKAFFTLNSDGTTLTPLSGLNFSFTNSDAQISTKYNDSKMSADDNTKNQIASDLSAVQVNGTQYTNVTSTNNLVANSTNNTITGNVVVSIGNWWNTQSSSITRSVNINLGSSSSSSGGDDTTPSTPSTPTTPSTPSNPTTPTNPSTPSSPSNSTSSINGSNTVSSATSTGAIVGYVILVLVIIAAIIAIAIFMHKKASKKPNFATLDRHGKIKRK